MVLTKPLSRGLARVSLTTLLLGCGTNSELEYFCDGYSRLSKNASDVSYSQTAIKITNSKLCVTWIGDQYSCAEIDRKYQSAWNEEDNGLIETRYEFAAKRDGEYWIMTVSEQQRPSKKASIKKQQTQEGWEFQANDIPLGLVLPTKYATEDNFRTFELYSVVNIAYWNGRMIHITDGEKSFGIHGSAYSNWSARANNQPSYLYKFNSKNEILVQGSINESDIAARLQCASWRKQKWWEI